MTRVDRFEQIKLLEAMGVFGGRVGQVGAPASVSSNSVKLLNEKISHLDSAIVAAASQNPAFAGYLQTYSQFFAAWNTWLQRGNYFSTDFRQFAEAYNLRLAAFKNAGGQTTETPYIFLSPLAIVSPLATAASPGVTVNPNAAPPYTPASPNNAMPAPLPPTALPPTPTPTPAPVHPSAVQPVPVYPSSTINKPISIASLFSPLSSESTPTTPPKHSPLVTYAVLGGAAYLLWTLFK